MSPEELDAIEKRVKDATKGPWFRETHGVMDAPRSYTVCMTGDSDQDRADAAFIACARSDVPALVAEVRRLWAAGEVPKEAPK